MKKEDLSGLEYVQAIVDGQIVVPLHKVLQIEFTVASHGLVEARMNLDPDIHDNSFGMAHGGAISSFLDATAGFAAYTVLPRDKRCATTVLTPNFVLAATDLHSVLTATGRVINIGETSLLSRAIIRNAEGRLVATADARMSIVNSPIVT